MTDDVGIIYGKRQLVDTFYRAIYNIDDNKDSLWVETGSLREFKEKVELFKQLNPDKELVIEKCDIYRVWKPWVKFSLG